MLANTTFHEVVLGLAFLVTLAIAGAGVLLGQTIPTELWTVLGSLFGIFAGVQLPNGAQRQQLLVQAETVERQSGQLTQLINTVAGQRPPA